MGKVSPRIPREHNNYNRYTVRGTPNCPLNTGYSGGGITVVEWDNFGRFFFFKSSFFLSERGEA